MIRFRGGADTSLLLQLYFSFWCTSTTAVRPLRWFVEVRSRPTSWGRLATDVPCVTGIQLESGAREETGRFRDVKLKDVSRPGIEPGSQELASCAITARPPQHDTTGPRHRAFDVFQGSSVLHPDHAHAQLHPLTHIAVSVPYAQSARDSGRQLRQTASGSSHSQMVGSC